MNLRYSQQFWLCWVYPRLTPPLGDETKWSWSQTGYQTRMNGNRLNHTWAREEEHFSFFTSFSLRGRGKGSSLGTMRGMLWKQWWDSPWGMSVCVFTEGLIRMGGWNQLLFTDWQPHLIERCPSKSREKARDLEEPGGPDGSKVQTSRGKSCQRDSELNVTRSDAFVFGAAHKGGHGGEDDEERSGRRGGGEEWLRD